MSRDRLVWVMECKALETEGRWGATTLLGATREDVREQMKREGYSVRAGYRVWPYVPRVLAGKEDKP